MYLISGMNQHHIKVYLIKITIFLKTVGFFVDIGPECCDVSYFGWLHTEKSVGTKPNGKNKSKLCGCQIH